VIQGTLGNAFQVIGFVLAVLSLFDVLRRRKAPFDVVGRGSRNVWIFTACACIYAAAIQGIAGFVGVFTCIMYLLDLRPKLQIAQKDIG
jgi:hypothetical protein